MRMVAPFEPMLPRPRRCRDIASAAYSLPELLVAVVILGILALGLTNFLNAQLFQSVRYEKGSRQTDDASRLQHLIETEVAESDQITYGGTLPPACGSGTDLFSLRIPVNYDAATGLPSTTTTVYFQTSSGLYRCGKPASSDGSLDLEGTTEPVLVSANLALELNTSDSSSKILDYSLKSPNGNAVVNARAYGQASVIR